MTDDVYLLGDGLLGPLSKRPAPSQEVRLFIDKDTGTTYISNGTAWIESGASLSGVTSDEQTPGGMVVAGKEKVLRGANLHGLVNAGETVARDLTVLASLFTGQIITMGVTHDGAVGANDGHCALNTLDGGGYASGVVWQKVPNGVSIPYASILAIIAKPAPGADPSVYAADAKIDSIVCLQDDGTGKPDFNGPSVGAQLLGLSGLSDVGNTGMYFRLNAAIDSTWWLGIECESRTPLTPFAFLDAAAGTTVATFASLDEFDATRLTNVGLQPQIYYSYARNKGLTVFDDNGPIAQIAASGASFTAMTGENGKTPPVSPASITGNVTTGSLANLQTVVGQLLTALDAKGSITKSTT